MKRRRSSGRMFAYFQFSSRDVGNPLAVSAAIAVRRRAAVGPAGASARQAFVCSSTMRAVSGVLMETSRRLRADPVVAAPLEFQCQGAIAAPGNAPAHQHMHEVRYDVFEQTLIVCDQR